MSRKAAEPISEFPKPPEPGMTYALDGPTGRRVPVPPPGKCGRSCEDCWPHGK